MVTRDRQNQPPSSSGINSSLQVLRWDDDVERCRQAAHEERLGALSLLAAVPFAAFSDTESPVAGSRLRRFFVFTKQGLRLLLSESDVQVDGPFLGFISQLALSTLAISFCFRCLLPGTLCLPHCLPSHTIDLPFNSRLMTNWIP